eukprot:CAMPEP_0114346304 /NCGR_PEP_ID=MMETSP0101-20121206/12945_1 /TAXON_ID=38822 ORGANISM="Pteridomonas danica, Strain PT" /NCGR_SAMPLE_ID=MMETSP0101 /ASSEMBLY_ACC=CAM_ASM_000211 /LENGTH=41 /DNA_ID= /DNA_START= /DNA_END= /DNA_ORIENTATION=
MPTKYAHPYLWNEETYWSAAKGGHLYCLQDVHENGCPWDED